MYGCRGEGTVSVRAWWGRGGEGEVAEAEVGVVVVDKCDGEHIQEVRREVTGDIDVRTFIFQNSNNIATMSRGLRQDTMREYGAGRATVNTCANGAMIRIAMSPRRSVGGENMNVVGEDADEGEMADIGLVGAIGTVLVVVSVALLAALEPV